MTLSEINQNVLIGKWKGYWNSLIMQKLIRKVEWEKCHKKSLILLISSQKLQVNTDK